MGCPLNRTVLILTRKLERLNLYSIFDLHTEADGDDLNKFPYRLFLRQMLPVDFEHIFRAIFRDQFISRSI